MKERLIDEINRGVTKVWIWKPGSNGMDWKNFQEEDDDVRFISLESSLWNEDVTEYTHPKDQFIKKYNLDHEKENARVKATCLWDFAKNTQIGDIIIACTIESNTYKAIGWCKIEGGYEYDKNPDDDYLKTYRHSIFVNNVHYLDNIFLPVEIQNQKLFFTQMMPKDAQEVCKLIDFDYN